MFVISVYIFFPLSCLFFMLYLCTEFSCESFESRFVIHTKYFWFQKNPNICHVLYFPDPDYNHIFTPIYLQHTNNLMPVSNVLYRIGLHYDKAVKPRHCLDVITVYADNLFYMHGSKSVPLLVLMLLILPIGKNYSNFCQLLLNKKTTPTLHTHLNINTIQLCTSSFLHSL
jgi:hypothetical protein